MLQKEWISSFRMVIILIAAFYSAGLSNATVNEARTARTSALQDLITSVEGEPKEPIRIFKTKDGYLRFIGAAPSTHFAVEVTKRGITQDAANAFLGKWRNLFVNESQAVEFRKIYLTLRTLYVIIHKSL